MEPQPQPTADTGRVAADSDRGAAEPGSVAAGTAATVETVFRIESPRVIAAVTRLVRDVGIAEELAQDALVAALEQWPRDGVPDNPGAWLMAAAKNRAVDLIRRRENYARKLAEIGRDLETTAPPRSPPTPTTSTTTCCAWSSPPATRCCRRSPASPSPSASSAV